MSNAHKQVCPNCGNKIFFIIEFETEVTCENSIALVCSNCEFEAHVWCKHSGGTYTGLKAEEKEQ